MWKIIASDFKNFWNDFKRVYPASLNWISSNWILSAFILLGLVSCFYLDTTIRASVIIFYGWFADEIFSFGRWFGNGQLTLILFLTLYIAGIILKDNKWRRTGFLIGEVYLLSGLITLICKSFFGRYRPYMNQGEFAFHGWTWSDNNYFSFFSGHSQTAMAISVVLASATENKILKTFYYSLAVITCLSRIYHDQHWLSDVFVGVAVSLLIGSQIVKFNKDSTSRA